MLPNSYDVAGYFVGPFSFSSSLSTDTPLLEEPLALLPTEMVATHKLNSLTLAQQTLLLGMFLRFRKQWQAAHRVFEEASRQFSGENNAIGVCVAQLEAVSVADGPWEKWTPPGTKKPSARPVSLEAQLKTLEKKLRSLPTPSTKGKSVYGLSQAEALARLQHYRGLALYRTGNYAGGVACFKEALALCPSHSLDEAKVLDSLAVHYERVGDVHLAHEALNKALVIKKKVGLPWEEAITAQILGRLHLIQEHYRQALHYLNRALDRCQKLDDRRRVESLYNTLLKLHLIRRHTTPAKQLLDTIEAHFAHPDVTPNSHEQLTTIAKLTKKKTVYRPNKAALALHREYVVSVCYRARWLFLNRDLDGAQALLEDWAIPWLQKHPAKKDLGKAYRQLACIHAQRGNNQATVETMGLALGIFRETNLVDEQAKTHFELGQAFWALGDTPLAMESLLEALKIAEQNGLRFMGHHIQETIHSVDPSKWADIENRRARYEPIFERERTLLEALTALTEQEAEDEKQAASKPTRKLQALAKTAKKPTAPEPTNTKPPVAAHSLMALLKVGQAMSGERNTDHLLDIVMTETKAALRCDRCTVFLYDSDRNELWSRVASGITSGLTSGSAKGGGQIIRFPAHLGLAGYVCKTGETLNIKNPYDDPRFNQEIDKKTGYTTENLLCIPMKNRENDIIGVFQVLNKVGGPFTRTDEDLLMAIAAQASVSIENAQRAVDQKKAFVSFIKTLSTTIDARDPITAGHSERVAKYAEIMGEELRIAKDDMEALTVSALLHDIGKIGVREDILTKQGRLTLEEYQHIQKHAEYTYDILKNIHFERHLRFVPEIAASHHEKMDGTGYFRGLEGNNIPFLGRILALSDVFDAITSRRHYRDRMPFDRVLHIVHRDAGGHFDPDVVDAFFKIPLYKLGDILLVEQRLISAELDHSFLAKLPNTLNVTIDEFYQLLQKKNPTKGEKLIIEDFSAIYHRGNLDTLLD
ncbi:MAG: HD domain-containing phosphohydrolase [Vampirovibrionales bacterium]|nr:HD domain-containing phosphohydrolase [Vampirovibrionales bacterium]